MTRYKIFRIGTYIRIETEDGQHAWSGLAKDVRIIQNTEGLRVFRILGVNGWGCNVPIKLSQILQEDGSPYSFDEWQEFYIDNTGMSISDQTLAEVLIEGNDTQGNNIELTGSDKIVSQDGKLQINNSVISIGGNPDAGFLFMTQAEGSISNWRSKCASNTATHSAGFNSQKSRGTLAAPLAIQLGDRIGVYSHGGYTGSLFNNAVRFITSANENWTPTANGGRLSIETTKTGTTADYESFRLEGSGLKIFGNGLYSPTKDSELTTKLTTDVLKASNSISAYRFAGGTTIRGVRYNGTAGAETAMVQYDQIVVFGVSGYDGTNIPSLNGGLYFFASQNWSTSNKGVQIKLRGTRNNASVSDTFVHWDDRARMTIGIGINADNPSIDAQLDIKSDSNTGNAIKASNLAGVELFKVTNTGVGTLLGRPIALADNFANNAATTALSKATLNSTYPDATQGFKVYCTQIIIGALVYEKVESNEWISYSVTNVT